MKSIYPLLAASLMALTYSAQAQQAARSVLVLPKATLFGTPALDHNPGAGHRPSLPGNPAPATSYGDVMLQGGNIYGGARDYAAQVFANSTMQDGASFDLYPRKVPGSPPRAGSAIVWSQLNDVNDGEPVNLNGIAFQVNQLGGARAELYRDCFTVTKQGDILLGGDSPSFPYIHTDEHGGAYDGTRLVFNGGRDRGKGTGNTDALFMHRYNAPDDHTALRVCVGDDGSNGADKMEIGSYKHDQNDFSDWVQGVALYANGQVFAHKVVVTENIYPDYVFKPSYRLAPLAEVEQKIKELGHLPGMPSAEQVEKDGMDLGEQNRLLVEKVEELTLHLIQMRKELDQIKAAKK